MAECESCGCTVPKPLGEYTCRGCGLVVCQSCVDVFDHWGEGLHGVGDPTAEVQALRARVKELEQALIDIERQVNQCRMWAGVAGWKYLNAPVFRVRRIRDIIDAAREGGE